MRTKTAAISTDSTGYSTAPAWSPDGRYIAFVSNRSGATQIYVTNAATNDTRMLTEERDAVVGDPSWSPDGRQILFSIERKGRASLCVMRADGTGQHPLFATTSVSSRAPSWVR